MEYISNAFSLQMIVNFPSTVKIEEIKSLPAEGENCKSCVGHPDTAAVLGVSCSRVNVSLQKGDTLFVAQLQGGRLPEGATTLPAGFSFKFLKVTIE